MASKTFFPVQEPTYTPFNAAKQDKISSKKETNNTFTMADTIECISLKNARMWQIIALVSLTSFFAALGLVIYAFTLPDTVPIIVTVDSVGNAVYVGKVDQSYYGNSVIPEQHKTSQIKKFITNANTWVIDRNAQQNYIELAGDLCQGAAITQLNSFFKENNPYDWIGYKTKTVNLQEPMRQTDNTYVIYYDVITYREGIQESVEKFSCLLTLDVYEVSEETKDKNPLGLYITSFDIKPVH